MKLNRFIPLLVFLTVLPGCSKPSTYKPSFASYGKEISATHFNDSYKEMSDDLNVELGFNYAALYENVETTLISSLDYSIKNRANGNSLRYYYQKEDNLIIDVKDSRFSLNESVKTYYDGDLDLMYYKSGKKGTGKTHEEKSTYGEAVGGVIAVADLDKHTYTESSLSMYYNFGYTVLLSYFSYYSMISGNDFTSRYSNCVTRYYSNGKILTMVIEGGTSSKLIAQISFKDCLSVKAKQIIAEENESSIKMISCGEATLKTTSKTVKKVDYSKFDYTV